MSDSHAMVRTFDAATAPRGALRHILPILQFPQVVWESRNLVANFANREFLVRYRGSTLGPSWVVVQPLLMFVIYYLVFGMLFGNYRAGQPPDPNFAFYLFSGTMGFSALTEATTNHCGVVVGNGNLVKKVAFPSEVLPLPGTLVTMSTWLVGVVVVWIAWAVCALCGIEVASMQLSWRMLMLPVVLVIQFVMILGIGLSLANLYVFVRDIRHIWGIVTMVWMFLSPVFWAPNTVIEKLGADTAESLFAFNPAYSLLMSQRMALGATDAVVDGGVSLQFGDFWGHLGASAAWAVAFLLIGYSTFMSRKHKYADLV
jgi:lipopolysaccharide transport system permease protein